MYFLREHFAEWSCHLVLCFTCIWRKWNIYSLFTGSSRYSASTCILMYEFQMYNHMVSHSSCVFCSVTITITPSEQDPDTQSSSQRIFSEVIWISSISNFHLDFCCGLEWECDKIICTKLASIVFQMTSIPWRTQDTMWQ